MSQTQGQIVHNPRHDVYGEIVSTHEGGCVIRWDTGNEQKYAAAAEGKAYTVVRARPAHAPAPVAPTTAKPQAKKKPAAKKKAAKKAVKKSAKSAVKKAAKKKAKKAAKKKAPAKKAKKKKRR